MQTSLLSHVIKTAIGGLSKTLFEGLIETGLLLAPIAHAAIRKDIDFWEGATEFIWILCGILLFQIIRAIVVVWKDIDQSRNSEVESNLFLPDQSRYRQKQARPAYFQVKLISIGVVGFTVLAALSCGARIVEVAKHSSTDSKKPSYTQLDWARVGPMKIVHSNEHSDNNDVYQIVFKNFGHLKAKQVGYLVTVTVVNDLDVSNPAHIALRKIDPLNPSLPRDVTEPQLLALLVDPQWDSIIRNSTLELNQDDMRMFRHLVTSSDVSMVLSGTSSFLFTIVFKWKDDSMSDNEIGVTEFCGVVSGHAEEFVDCGTKSFRAVIKQPKRQ